MICLTGDVHHMSMHSLDQAFLSGSEVDATFRYVDIASCFGIQSTLFVTGKCVEEEYRRLEALSGCDEVEIGGHNYNAFKPLMPYRLSKLLLRRRNGPAFVQKRDIAKTINIIKEALSVDILSWRDHGYRHDANTNKLLYASGIKYVSDVRSSALLAPYWIKGLCHMPINILPDHDHIYHGAYQNRSNMQRNKESKRSPFGYGRMDIGNWFQVVKGQVEHVVSRGGVATLLVHPACMEIEDNFKTFTKLCGFLAKFQSVKMCQAA